LPIKIETEKAPAAIGPYSQALKSGNLIFVSGQLPINIETGEIPADIASQVKYSLTNIKSILEAQGSSLSKVLKVGVFLVDLADFQVANEVYATFFKEPFPARTTVQITALPKGAKVEIDAVAEI
jgi:2-iminobutanoate/2-iminopropanoate deaminase